MKVKTHRRRKHRKSNPAKSHKTTHRRRHNPAPSAHRRRRTHRRRRSNPSGAVMDVLLPILTGIGGIGVGAFLNNTAAKWIPVKWRGVAALLLGGGVAFFGRRHKIALAGGTTIAAAGGWDLLRQNVPLLTAFSAEDAGYLLGSAAAEDEELAAMLGAMNSAVPGVVPNMGYDPTDSVPMGSSNSRVPGVLPNMGYDPTDTIPMGFDSEGDGLFSDDLLL